MLSRVSVGKAVFCTLLAILFVAQSFGSCQATMVVRYPGDPEFTIQWLHLAVWLMDNGTGCAQIEGAIAPTTSNLTSVRVFWPYPMSDIRNDSVGPIDPYLPHVIYDQRPRLQPIHVSREEGLRQTSFTLIEIQFPRGLLGPENGMYSGVFGVRFNQAGLAERVPWWQYEKWRTTLYLYHSWLSYEFWHTVSRENMTAVPVAGKTIDVMLPKGFRFESIYPSTAKVDLLYVWEVPHGWRIDDTVMRIRLETPESSLSLMVEYSLHEWYQDIDLPLWLTVLISAIFFVLGLVLEKPIASRLSGHGPHYPRRHKKLIERISW